MTINEHSTEAEKRTLWRALKVQIPWCATDVAALVKAGMFKELTLNPPKRDSVVFRGSCWSSPQYQGRR